MAEVDLKIGGRTYKVACQDGEEDHLIAAAGTLNAEAETVLEQRAGSRPRRLLLKTRRLRRRSQPLRQI